MYGLVFLLGVVSGVVLALVAVLVLLFVLCLRRGPYEPPPRRAPSAMPLPSGRSSVPSSGSATPAFMWDKKCAESAAWLNEIARRMWSELDKTALEAKIVAGTRGALRVAHAASLTTAAGLASLALPAFVSPLSIMKLELGSRPPTVALVRTARSAGPATGGDLTVDVTINYTRGVQFRLAAALLMDYPAKVRVALCAAVCNCIALTCDCTGLRVAADGGGGAVRVAGADSATGVCRARLAGAVTAGGAAFYAESAVATGRRLPAVQLREGSVIVFYLITSRLTRDGSVA